MDTNKILAKIFEIMNKLGIKKEQDKVLHFAIIFGYAIFAAWSVSIFFAVFSSQIIMIAREVWNVWDDWKNNGRPINIALEKFDYEDIIAGEFGLIFGLFLYQMLKMLF